MLEGLQQRWFTLSNEGWHDVIVGFLRDKQVETAIETLQAVQRQGIRIQPWLYDTILYNLCDVEEFDEALSILQFRVDNGEQLISGELWYYFLDTASRALHHAATLYAWRERVETGYLNPPSGICLNVLNVAARHSDSALATSVFRILGSRTQTLQLYHYEALLESYLPTNLKMAFTVLTLMIASGQPPTDSTTRPLFLHLRQSASLPSAALSILRDLKKQNHSIPPEAVNVIIESFIHHNDLDAAVEVYKKLHTLSPKGATTATFNILFRGCRTRKDLAMFLAAEMVAMKLAPNPLTYDRLILVCLSAAEGDDGMDDAWRYFNEMRKVGWWPRLGTSTAMARKCCERGDDRIWKLVGEQEGTLSRQTIERLVKKDWQGEVEEKWRSMGMAQLEETGG